MWARSSTRTSGPALAFALLLGGVACGGGAPEAGTRELTVAVASSLRHAMPDLIAAFERGVPGVNVVLTYGGSGALRKQVEAGAPIDAVVLAGAGPVDALIEIGMAEPASRRVLAHNELVLIVPLGGAEVTFATLDQLPIGEHIAIGDPASVPAGRYARDALENLGQWERVAERMVLAPHVAAVLAYARRGEVAAAIVYRTDVRSINDVEVRDVARGAWAPAPEVVAAVTGDGAAAADAAELLTFASSEKSRAILAGHGFALP